MKVLFCATTNQTINLIQQIAHSGEGEVWTTNWNGMLAKLYHQPSAEKFVKLGVMIAHQPQDPNQAKNHHSFTFPQSLIKDNKGQLVGFLMYHIKDTVELIDIYNPKRRKLKKLEIDWHFLHYLALNISSIVAVIHQEGYVIGDIKPQNILVNSQALPTFIDVDSFQVKNPQTGEIYRCVVGTEGYTPPELIGEDFHQAEQNYAHDNFRLGVLIYQLLFSYHPFGSGIWQSGDKPDMNELIKRGIWLEGNQNFLSHSPNTMPLSIIHPLLRNCFLRCFNDGHGNPSARPSAQDWYYALSQAVNDLKICSQVDSHIHYAQDQICSWCARKNSLGIDIFELPSGIKSTAKQRVLTRIQANSSIFQQKEILRDKDINIIQKIIVNTDNFRLKKFNIFRKEMFYCFAWMMIWWVIFITFFNINEVLVIFPIIANLPLFNFHMIGLIFLAADDNLFLKESDYYNSTSFFDIFCVIILPYLLNYIYRYILFRDKKLRFKIIEFFIWLIPSIILLFILYDL
ncbi:MAG: hypothetical protein IGQ45_01775 [Cyanobacterium sp. T60_A2020_053]|nr:hypothetical protein [Cyanobacterium sp. T60_A2020_053]